MKMKQMNYKYGVIFFLMMLSVLTGNVNAANTQPIVPLDSVVAIVNNDVITKSELDTQVRIVQNQVQHSGNNAKVPSKQELQTQVLNHIIDQTLQLQMAKQQGVTVDDAAVNASVAQIAQQNNLTMEQFHQALQQQGMNYNAFVKDVRNRMIVTKLQQQAVAPNVTISQQEVSNYIKAMQNQKIIEYRLSSIFVALPETPSPEQLQAVEQKVGSILSQLHSGADFSQLAMIESNGPNALKGGDMGWVQAAQLPPEIAPKIANLTTGSLLGPLRTQNGFVILKLLGSRQADNRKVITQIKARHILLKTNALFTDADAKAELLKLRAEIVKGASFAALAKKYSQDPGSAVNGGDLGWVSPGELVPPFEAAMDTLQPGQMSQPVQTQYGWHLIQVEQKRQQDVTVQAQENQVRNYIFQRKFQEQLQNWLGQLHDMAYIKIMLGGPGKMTEKMANPKGQKNSITEQSGTAAPAKNLLPPPNFNPAKNTQNGG